MALLKWKNLQPISQPQPDDYFSSIRNELDRVADRMFNDYGLAPMRGKHFQELTISPSIDVLDEGNQVKVVAELAGIDENDIDLSISGGLLVLKATKSLSRKDQDENKDYYLREIGYGSYERHLALPANLDTNRAKATFKKGMLWVEIPKLKQTSAPNQKLSVKKL